MTLRRNTSLNIIELNVNSIISLQRRHNLTTFLADYKPDIMLLCETRLNPKHVFNIRSYELVRTDKLTIGSVGTAVLIRDNIKHEKINITPWQLKTLECTAVLVYTSSIPVCIISIYRHELHTDLIADLEKITDECHRNNWSLVMGGDFNARHPDWHNTTSCSLGRQLAQWMLSNSIARQINIESPADPTFLRGAYTSILDFFIISSSVTVRHDQNSTVLKTISYDSDHRAIQMRLSLNDQLQRQECRTSPNYKNVNWSHFKNQLDANLQEVHIPSTRNLSSAEIDDKLEQMNNAIRTTMSEVIPTVTHKKDSNIILPQDVLDLIQQKKRMRRRRERMQQHTNCQQLSTEIRLLSQIIDERIKIAQNAQWTNTISSIKMGPAAFKKIKSICKIGGQNSPKTMIDPATGVVETNPDQIADILANQFAEVHRQNDDMGSQAHNDHVSTVITQLSEETHVPRTIFSFEAPANPTVFNKDRHLLSVANLKAILKKRANKISTGHDQIPNIVLRKLSHKCIVKIATLFNQIYNIGYFPPVWKSAIVIPIPKKNKPENQPSSFRPISLLPCLGKVYECAFKERIELHCEDHNILPEDQFGFRSARSTTQALVILKTDVGHAFNQRTPTIACSTDIEKAFDTVWQNGLVFKMKTAYHFDDHTCRCVLSYLSNRSFRVRIEHSLSREHNIDAGVPQGGSLSALLYILYIADMPTPPPHFCQIRRLQFADDMLIYVSTKNLADGEKRINEYLKHIVQYLNKWKVKINPSKCESIVFKGPYKRFGASANKLHNKVSVLVNGQALIPQQSLKYLGITFKKNLSNIPHVNQILAQVNRAYFSLKPVLKKINGLDPRLKSLCYKQLIRPIITYGFPCWSDISSHQMDRLRKIERVCIRACTNTHRFSRTSNTKLYKAGNIMRIDREMVAQTLRFFDKTFEDSPLTQSCKNIDPDYIDNIRTVYKPPWYIVHLHNSNQLFEDDKLMLYHRRFNPLLRHLGPVYNQNQ